MQYTITMPDSFTVQVHGQNVEVDLGKINATMIMQAATLGLRQKLVNGAASALVDAIEGFADSLKDAGQDDTAVRALLDDDRMVDRKAWGKLNPKALQASAVAGVEKVRDSALYAGSWEIKEIGRAHV